MKTRSLSILAITLFATGLYAQKGGMSSGRIGMSSGPSHSPSISSGGSGGTSWGTRSNSSGNTGVYTPKTRTETGSGSGSGSSSMPSRGGSNASSGSSSGTYNTSGNSNQPYYNNGSSYPSSSGGSNPVYDNSRTSGASDEQVRSTALKDIRNTLAGLDQSRQSYTVSGTEPSTLTGMGGTMMRINPADLETVDGHPITGDIQVDLKELDCTQKMGLAGTPTMSNGEMLISGGSYYFGMSSGGKEVKLKEGKSMEVNLPRLANSEDDMELFTGEVDNNGNVNWRPVTQPLKPAAAGSAYGNENPTGNGNTGNTEGSGNGNYTGPGRPDNNGSTLPPRGNTNGSNGNGNTNTSAGNRPAQNYYQPINITSMGYVNADKYIRGGIKMSVEVENADPAATQVYLVFKNRRSLVEGQPERGFVSNNFLFTSVPRNEEIKVVAISKSNGKTYAGEVYSNTKDKKQFVTLQPVEDTYLNKAFEYTK